MLRLWDRFFHRMRRKSFFAHTVTMMGGTAVAQGIALLGTLVLARFYLPSHFGVFSMFAGVISLIGILSAFRYEVAIPLPEEEEDAATLARFSLLILGIVSLVILLIVVFACIWMSPWIRVRFIDLRPGLPLLPLCILLVGASNTLYNWCLRGRRFRGIVLFRLAKSTATFLGQLIAYPFVALPGGGLIFGYIIGLSAGLVPLLRRSRTIFTEAVDRSRMVAVASRYSEFPKKAGIGAFLDAAAVQIPLIALPVLFSPHIGGSFAVADRLLRGAVDFFSMTLGPVFYQRVARFRRDREEATSLLIRTWKLLFACSVGPIVLLFLFGQEIFTFLLGTKWGEAGEYAAILAVGFLTQLVVSPTSLGLMAFEKLNILLGWQILSFLAMTTALVLAFLFWRNDIKSFLWLWSCKEVILYLLYGGILYRIHAGHEKSLSA